MTQHNMNKRLIFVDVETTGTDEEKDSLLEVAAVITGEDLAELGVYEAAIWQPRHVVENVSPFIQGMHGPDHMDHTKPCLLEMVRASKKEARDVEKELLTFFHKHGVEPNEGVLAGNSVHFDRRFLQKNMPLLEAFFYHRMFDVSALKTAAQMWRPELLPPPPKAHRALADVRSSINLARIFKEFFQPLYFESLDQQAAEVARDFGEDLPTKTEQLKKRIIEVAHHHHHRVGRISYPMKRLADAACDLLRKSENRLGVAERKLEDALNEYDPNWSTR